MDADSVVSAAALVAAAPAVAPFGEMSWQVVLMFAGYLVLLGMQLANLVSTRNLLNEVRKDLKDHLADRAVHSTDSKDDARRLRAIERTLDQFLGPTVARARRSFVDREATNEGT